MDEVPHSEVASQGTAAIPAEAKPTSPLLTVSDPTPCEATSLVGEAKTIAAGLTSLATHFTKKEEPSVWRARLRHAKPLLLAFPALIAALFAMEQFLESHEETESSRAEARFSATTEQLGSPQLAIQAAAVHSLPRLAIFRDVPRPQPGDYFPGSHLINRFVRSRREYPFMQRSWALFREFAAQPRTSGNLDPSSENVVSSAILQEGAAWEMRRRTETSSTDLATGALLFKASLPNAHGIHQDFRRINFGTVDFSNADLDGSNFDECGLSGAHLNGGALRGASFKFAYLADAKMPRSDWSFARLDDADFERAELEGAKFTQANLTRANFTGSNLDNAIFSQATASHTVFKNASLKKASFSQVDVSSASFDGADVDGADFTTSVGFTIELLKSAKDTTKARLPTAYATKGRKRP
jgi:uncharacterized protein YjbI with pentapeptide repeats